MEYDSRQFNIVITGHVDHGKSTVIGRLLADTGSLPEGKLEGIREYCRKNSKTFEYAFLLDALKEEQSQGITIDAARIFFRTGRRDTMIIDAPGHMEFLKNMITGAARADAALIVIDAREGIQANSRRHGYLLSMLGIRQVAVVINKMDLVGWSREVYESLRSEYGRFLEGLGLVPSAYIPVSARNGDNLVDPSENLSWYSGPTVTGQIDLFEWAGEGTGGPFRFSVQDVYKFTDEEDDRRILAGQVAAGSIRRGDPVRFHPSGQRSVIRSIERFGSREERPATAGESVGFTLDDALYIRPGELMVHDHDSAPPESGKVIRANLFWMGHFPLAPGRKVILRIGSARVQAELKRVLRMIDALTLGESEARDQIERFDVAECLLETRRIISFDRAADIPETGRFVLVDRYEICGAGIVLDNSEAIDYRESGVSGDRSGWDHGLLPRDDRERRNGHKARFVLLTGEDSADTRNAARRLEKILFDEGLQSFYAGPESLAAALDGGLEEDSPGRDEGIRRLGELARLMTEAGQIFIAAAGPISREELETLRGLCDPHPFLTVGFGPASGVADLMLDKGGEGAPEAIRRLLVRREIIPDWSI